LKKNNAITVHIYYTGENGSAKAFVKEMLTSGLVDEIKKEKGNRRYEYFFSVEDEETVLLVDIKKQLIYIILLASWIK